MGLLQTTKKMFTVNVRMIPSKFFYAFFGVHIGSYASFLNIFFISVGLTVSEAGFINGLMNAAPILTGPLWGYLADKTGYQRIILFILTTGASAAMFAMPFVAGAIHPYSAQQQNIICNSTQLVNNTVLISEEACKQDTTLFWSLLALALTASIFLQPLPNFIEAIISNIAKSGEDDASYGAQRFIGSISMGTTNFVVGKAAEMYKDSTLSPYAVVFYIYLAATLMFFPIGCLLISQLGKINKKNKNEPEDNSKDTSNIPKSDSKKELGKDLFRLFRKFDVIFFLLTVFMSGTVNCVFWSFTYLFLNDEYHVGKSEMTYVVIVGILSEAFVFPFTAKLIKILKYPVVATIVGTLAHSIRFFVMYMKVPFECLIAVQLLSGIAFALSLSSFFEQIHVLAPPELSITMKSVMLVCFMSGGTITANMAGGKLYQDYGPRKLFLFTSFLCAFWVALMLMQFIWKRIKENAKGSNSIELDVQAECVIENKNVC